MAESKLPANRKRVKRSHKSGRSSEEQFHSKCHAAAAARRLLFLVGVNFIPVPEHISKRRFEKWGKAIIPRASGEEDGEGGGIYMLHEYVRRPFSTPTPHKSTRANICADAASAAPSSGLRRGGSGRTSCRFHGCFLSKLDSPFRPR